MNQEKKHMYMVAANVVFTDADGNLGTVGVNALVNADQALITERVIAKANVNAQQAFYKKAGIQPVPTVVDVVLINIVYLGHMTQEEFLRPPEGQTKVQVPSQVQ